MESVAGIIPARFESKRFPGKLLAPLMNKPIIQHTYENALKCKCLDKIFVATDSEKIAEYVKSFGGNVVYTSPDCENGTHRIAEALKSSEELSSYSTIVNIQGDHPFTAPDTISAIVQKLTQDPEAMMSTAVVLLTDIKKAKSTKIVKCIFNHQHRALYFSRSLIPFQKSNMATYYHHLGVYCYRSDFLLNYQTLAPSSLEKAEDLEQLRLLENGFVIKVAIVNEAGHAIDTPEDLSNLELYLCQ